MFDSVTYLRYGFMSDSFNLGIQWDFKNIIMLKNLTWNTMISNSITKTGYCIAINTGKIVISYYNRESLVCK